MQFYPSGTRIAGRYEVAGRPLVGGMGLVYLCFDHEEQRPVALKTFKPESLPDRAARERFLEEGNTWVRLGKHPHIVQAYTVVRIGDDREVYLVLELVAKEEGRRDASLRAWLTPGRPLPADQAMLIALQIVRGMRHATDTIPGFVHRDLKPENVLVGADRLNKVPINRVRVTDFGLVKGLRADQVPQAQDETDWASRPGRLTRAGSVLGTPHYMAPEQWDSADVDVRADIYAFGCLVGEMLTGRLLVQGGLLDSLRRAHQGGQALASARPAAPPALQDLLASCLAVESNQRYQDWTVVETVLVAAHDEIAGKPAPEAEAAGDLNRVERVAAGWSANAMGASYLDMGNAQTALTYFERARQAGQTEGQLGLEAAGLNHLGLTYAQLGDARRAVGFLEQALAIHRAIGDINGEGDDLGNLGSTYLYLGDARRAVSLFEQALAIRRQIGNRRGEGNDLGNLGNAYVDLGDAQRAIGFYRQALAIRREISDRHGEGTILGNLGEAYRLLGDAQRAIGFYEQALTIRREIGDRRGEGNDLGNLGNAYLQLSAAQRAISFYEQALAIRLEISDRRGESLDLGNLGNAYLHLGDTPRAIGFYEQSLAIRRQIGDRHGEGADLGNLGNAYLQMGDAQRAIGYYEQAVAVRRQISDRRGEGIDLGNLGSAYHRWGDFERAIGFYQQAMAVRRQIGDLNGVATLSFNMALLYSQRGDPAQALPLAREAARLLTQIGHSANAQLAMQLIAQLERQGE